MKLRNKKTGEILESARSSAVIKDKFRIYDELNDKYYTYNSLAELNEEWEDVVEEPKEYWYVNEFGTPTEVTHTRENIYDKQRKNFGNYFSSREEAEKAVEKLKAWKRLKDKGIVIKKLRHNENGGDMYWSCPSKTGISDKQIWLDLDLLFGGEE